MMKHKHTHTHTHNRVHLVNMQKDTFV